MAIDVTALAMPLSEQLSTLLGERGWITPPHTQAWQRDWLNKFGKEPLGVARPTSADEVVQVVSLCLDAGIQLVPQGGNTGLVGGGVLAKPGGVILSMSRMDRIGEPDFASGTIEVEAGVVLSSLHKRLDGTGFMFPMHLGAEGSAQLGGLISTNAGGSHAFRYGMMQDLVLGLEVVLPDGEIWPGLRRVQKDNAGYQLRKLFCGAEGTLGIITKAVLKLVPAPTQQVTALLAVPTIGAACQLATRLRREAGEFLEALEFFSDFGLGMALAHVPSLYFPLSRRAPFYLLVEAGAGSSRVPLSEIISDVMAQAIEGEICHDAVLAGSEAQRRALWRLREEQPEGQRLAGLQLKHDISVPPGKLPDFLEHAGALCQELLPGIGVNAFGHLGDGNVHFNLSPPQGFEGFANCDGALATKLGELASRFGGSFAAEHGLGQAKAGLAMRLQSPVELRCRHAIRAAFDPAQLINQTMERRGSQ